MRVLYVVASCLTKNTSANMSHNAYVQGLLENGCEVDILMAQDSWGEEDKALPRWEKANYYVYRSVSLADRIRRYVGKQTRSAVSQEKSMEIGEGTTTEKQSAEVKLRILLKQLYYAAFPVDPVYPLDKEWLKQAAKFRSNERYDMVISNSSPSASHKLVVLLRAKGNIHFNRWVQIWEDPWYYDLYGNRDERVKEEEHALLREASEVYYVSPLTLMYQKQYYSDCAHKMKCIPLPFLKLKGEGLSMSEEVSFGYFGDYYAKTRNLKPFYAALLETGARGYICGDTDICLKPTEQITVSGRMTLDKLAEIQERTGVLVHLCNLRGGQIPGKVYHYSATMKPILFILDGLPEEKRMIREFFGKFNRYCFCDNDPESISDAIKMIMANKDHFRGMIVDAFEPKQVVMKILRDQPYGSE